MEDDRRIRQLEQLNAMLRASINRYRSARDRVIADRAKIQADLDSLTADMRDLSQ